MSSSLRSILGQWYSLRDDTGWVLCTLYKIEGSSYRKPGAMMMFSGDGAQLGLLSGGCLEGDIQRHANQVMQSNKAKTLIYDATDEDDITFHLGIGCGGIVHILMQPVNRQNDYLQLDAVYAALKAHEGGVYLQNINRQDPTRQARFEAFDCEGQWSLNRNSKLISCDNETWLETQIYPEPHLLVIGGGYDARALTHIAKQLGWTVSLWDTRPANARKAYFADVNHIARCPAVELERYVADSKVTATILMSHNVKMDSDVLRAIAGCPLKYIGLLGPEHRKVQVIEQSGIDLDSLSIPLAGPVGLRIGGDTPESIALSVLAEIHAAICQKDGASISGIL